MLKNWEKTTLLVCSFQVRSQGLWMSLLPFPKCVVTLSHPGSSEWSPVRHPGTPFPRCQQHVMVGRGHHGVHSPLPHGKLLLLSGTRLLCSRAGLEAPDVWTVWVSPRMATRPLVSQGSASTWKGQKGRNWSPYMSLGGDWP